MKGTAKFISVIFHPLLIPTLGFLILFNSGTYLSFLDFDFKKMIFIIVVLSTCLIPLSLIPFFIYQKMIFSFQLPEKRERYIPLGVTLLLYFFCYMLLRRVPIPPLYHAFCFASIIAVIITLAITLKWKISLHMVGLGGLTGLIAFLIFTMRINLEFYLIFSIMAAGLTGSARLLLEAHKPSQLYAGFIVGLVTIPAVMFIY
jgi:hypothetical protein